MYKRTLALLLALCMTLSVFPLGALAAEADHAFSFQVTHVNPLYADVVTEEDLHSASHSASTYSVEKGDVTYLDTVEEAADYMRPLLTDRTEAFTVAYATKDFDPADENSAKTLTQKLFDAAVAHTGKPHEGDSLMWQHGGWDCNGSGVQENGVYYLTLDYTVTYYTTAAQEKELDTAIENLLADLELRGLTDYQKLKVAYDWICKNVTYDYTNLNNKEYTLKYTPYAALVNKTAVCQGYALLLYRLALEMGIDSRLIPGTANNEAHGWNILKLGDKYYNADSTWDAGKTQYDYFLKSNANFADHTPDAEYDNRTFYASYPMSDKDYVPSDDEVMDEEDTTLLVDRNNEVLTISGNGAIADYEKSEDTPWYKYRDSITTLVIGDGITRIGNYAFDQFTNLTSVTIADSVVSIGEYALSNTGLSQVAFPAGLNKLEAHAFQGCTALTSVTIPASIAKVNEMTFEGCSALAQVKLPEGLTAVGQKAFANCTSLTAIAFPETVTKLENYAFQGCTALTAVTIPAAMTEVGTGVFSGCSGLTEVNLPDSLTALGQSAFANCTGLTEFHFPAGLTTIGKQALQGCTGLKELYFVSDAPASISADAFQGVSATAYYPAGNSTWTSAVMVNYGGSIVWAYYCPNGHDYVPEERDVTCTTAGGTYYICSACGDTFIQNEVAALGHNYVDHVCTRCGEEEKVLPAPVAKAENIASSGKIRISWDAVEGAASYNVYYSTNKYDNYTLLKNVEGTKLNHTSAKVGTTYYYCVTSIDASGKEFGTDFPEENIIGATCKLARPEVTVSNVASSGKIRIEWEAVEGAAGYEIWRSEDGGETYTRLSTAKATSTGITNTSAKVGVQYRYKVKAIGEDAAVNSAFSSAKYRTCDLPRPTITLGNKASTGKITISWEAVEGAVKYQVYRSEDGGETYSRLSTTSKTSIVNTSAEAGVKYRYKVRAVAENTDANSAYSSAKDRTCDLPQPEIRIGNVASSGKIRVSWAAVEGAVKYKVYRSTDGENFEYLTSTTKTAITNTSAEAGKTYYYKVRAVHENSDGTSAYSAAVSGVCNLARPVVSITLDGSGKPVVTWEKVEGAVKYEVYYHNDATSKFELLTTTDATGINHIGAKAGETCYYRVVALSPDGSWDSAKSAEVFVPCVSVDVTKSELMEDIIDCINEYREEYGVEELAWYEDGALAAQIRAAEVTVKMDAERPDGGSCEELLDLYGLYYELDLQVEPGTTAQEIVDILMADEDAAAICMYEEFTFGIAACNADCWVIMFGGENL